MNCKQITETTLGDSLSSAQMPLDRKNCQYDFNKLYEMGYACIEVLISKCSRLYHDLCGWDCDSICIWDPDAVEEVMK